MNCPKCDALNEGDAKFCRNCGADLTAASGQGSSKDLMYVLIFLSWEYFIYLVWFVLQKGIVPILTRRDNMGAFSLYRIFGWAEDIVSIVLLIVFMALVKNRTAKILFVVFLVVRIIMLIGYRILT
ncbi:MAG: zinc-ribbon domain-containing protein [Mucilaginibacter sp.]